MDYNTELKKFFHDYVLYTIPGVSETVESNNYDYILIDGLNYMKANNSNEITYNEIYDIVNTLSYENQVINPVVLIFFKEANFYNPNNTTGVDPQIPVFVYKTSTCSLQGFKDANIFYEWLYATYFVDLSTSNVESYILSNIGNRYNPGAGLINYNSIDINVIQSIDELYSTSSNFRTFVYNMLESFESYIDIETDDGSYSDLSYDEIFKIIVHNLKSYDDNVLFRKTVGLLAFGKKVILISNDKFDFYNDGTQNKYKFLDKKLGFADTISYSQYHPTFTEVGINTNYQFYPSYDERDANGNLLWRNNVFNVPEVHRENLKAFVYSTLLNGPNFLHLGHLKNSNTNEIITNRPRYFPNYTINVSDDSNRQMYSQVLGSYLTKIYNGTIYPTLIVNPTPPADNECAAFDYTFSDFMDIDMSKKYLKYKEKYLKYKNKYLTLKKKLGQI